MIFLKNEKERQEKEEKELIEIMKNFLCQKKKKVALITI